MLRQCAEDNRLLVKDLLDKERQKLTEDEFKRIKELSEIAMGFLEQAGELHQEHAKSILLERAMFPLELSRWKAMLGDWPQAWTLSQIVLQEAEETPIQFRFQTLLEARAWQKITHLMALRASRAPEKAIQFKTGKALKMVGRLDADIPSNPACTKRMRTQRVIDWMDSLCHRTVRREEEELVDKVHQALDQVNCRLNKIVLVLAGCLHPLGPFPPPA